MHKPVKHLSTLSLLLVLITLMASSQRSFSAAAAQPLASIHATVSAFVLSEHDHDPAVNVRSSKLDPRLRLARCGEALEAFWAPGSRLVGNTTIGVRCVGPRPWKLYVPTQVSKQAEVVIVARALTRGHRIGVDDLRVEMRDLARIGKDAIRSPTQVLGYVVRHGAGAGQVLKARMLSAPLLVEKGHTVRLINNIPGLAIYMSGVSLDDGARGESVRVRNPVSNRVVRARVVTAGVVQIN